MNDSRYTFATQMNSNEEDNPQPQLAGNPFVQINRIPQVSFIYDIYIGTEIIVPAAYSEVFSIMHVATPQDEIHFKLNTPGGDGYTARQFIHNIERTQAFTVAFAEAEVASAGTFIFLESDAQVVQQYSDLMIHNFSTVIGGKGHEIRDWHKHLSKSMNQMVKETYKDFLTKKEIKRVIAGDDFWMGAEEIKQRLERRQKKRERRAQEEMKTCQVLE